MPIQGRDRLIDALEEERVRDLIEAEQRQVARQNLIRDEEELANNRVMRELHNLMMDQAMPEPMFFVNAHDDVVRVDPRDRVAFNNLRREWGVFADEDFYGKSVFKDAEPFVPEPEKVVEIGEDDVLSDNYDTDDDAETTKLDDNKSFYDKTQGVLDEVSRLYEELASYVLHVIEGDSFYKENGHATIKNVDKVVIHALYVVYRENKVMPLDRALEHVLGRQKSSIDYHSTGDTYLYKSMQEVVDKARSTFDNIGKLGEIKLSPNANESVIVINDTEYHSILNSKRNAPESFKPKKVLGFTINIRGR